MRLFIASLMIILFVISSFWNCSTQPSFTGKDLEGYWHAPLPANPRTDVILYFELQKEDITGKAYFADGESLKSEEPIRNIVLSGNKINFDLPGAATHYSGKVTNSGIKGGFNTPGNPFLKLSFTRTSLHELTASASIIKANTPFDPDRLYTEKELTRDFGILADAIRTHPKIYSYHTKEEVDRFLLDQKSKIREGMKEIDFIRLVTPVIAYLKCVHSRLILPDKVMTAFTKRYKSIPLDIIYLEKHAYVLKDLSDNPGITPGCQILEINGRSAGEIFDELALNVSSDINNISHITEEINRNFWLLYHYIDNSDHFEIKLRRLPGNAVESVSVPAIESARILTALHSPAENENPADPNSLPLNLNIREGTGILRVKSFNYADPNKYKETVSSCFAELKKKEIKNLIVDLRGNTGGQPFLSADLFSYFIREPYPYFRKPLTDSYYFELLKPVKPAANHFTGNMYFLADGNSLSSTGHLLSLIKYHRLGNIAGSIPGGSFSCNDNSKLYKLPNSMLQFTVAQTTYTAAVEGFNTGDQVIPDFPVKPGISGIIDGKDITMEYVRNMIP